MKTCAVILHYAADFHKCMEAAKKAGVDEFVLVDNSRRNIGVGAGYKEGIERALKTDCYYILLLDDDNLLREDALNKLKDAYMEFVFLDDAVACSRAGTKVGESIRYFINSYNAVLGLHIFNYKSTKRYTTKISPYVNDKYSFTTCAMFGGLFFHKSLIERIGLPDEKFTMYAGDYEWTSRMDRGIAVVHDARIDEPPSNQNIYETTKGHVMFQKKLATNRFIFWINYRIYLLYLLWKRDKVKRRALKDGYKA